MNGVKVNDFIDRTLANCKEENFTITELEEMSLEFSNRVRKIKRAMLDTIAVTSDFVQDVPK
nr:hypothetical protein [uncultured Faecalimonas sp.]